MIAVRWVVMDFKFENIRVDFDSKFSEIAVYTASNRLTAIE